MISHPGKAYPLHLALAGASALACLVWLLLIPGDAKNALAGGYSAARLGMAAVLLAGALICTVLAIQSWRLPGRWQSFVDDIVSAKPRILIVVLALAVLGLMAGLALLLLPAGRLGDLKYAFARLKPVIAWFTLLMFQSMLFSAQTYTRCNQALITAARNDFNESLARLRRARMLLPALIAGGLAGGLAAFLIRPAGQEIFKLQPWLPWAILGFSLCFLLLGLLFNLTLVKVLPYSFAVLVLLSIIVNLWMGQADAIRFNARLSALTGDDSVSLGNRYHYSLSVYQVLSKMYPGSPFVAAPGLLKAWNLDENQLKSWVPVPWINEQAYDPLISADEAQQILDQNPVKMEINTVEGTRFYYFLPRQPSDTSPIVLLYEGNRRFVLPIGRFNQLFPQRAFDP